MILTIYLSYFASLALVFSFYDLPPTLTLGWFLFYCVGAYIPSLFISAITISLFKKDYGTEMELNNPEAMIIALHIAIAFVVHPSLGFDEAKTLTKSEQHILINRIPTKFDENPTFSRDYKLLVNALGNQARASLKEKSPLTFWLYPPTILFLFWSVFFLYLSTKGDFKNRRFYKL